LIAHNLRSSHNVGSLLRTCDGLDVDKVYLTGYTPYPQSDNDTRVPYLAQRIDNQIHKTALGAEKSVPWDHSDEISPLLLKLHAQNYVICALEQTPKSIQLPDFIPPQKLAIIVGREVEGIEPEIIAAADSVIEIPMLGTKESFNVSIAAAIALYCCRYHNLPVKT